jgi:ABC-type bacteriocin/lantibiotic exporter with double-glycine peptidase domain
MIGCAGSPVPGLVGNQTDTKSGAFHRPTGYPGSSDAVVHVMVPFYPDDSDQCGPATLASILTYWGIPSDPSTLKEETYTPRLRGTLPIDLLLTVQARGLQAEGVNGTLETLKAELNVSHPVVALLNLGWAVFPQGHYVVITGYDEQQQGIYMHSGLARDLFVPYEKFLGNWEKTGRWMLLVQPAYLPATAHEQSDRRG